jgi:hypothetical protein
MIRDFVLPFICSFFGCLVFCVYGWFLSCLLGYLVSQNFSQDAGYKTNNYINIVYYKPMNILHVQAEMEIQYSNVY